MEIIFHKMFTIKVAVSEWGDRIKYYDTIPQLKRDNALLKRLYQTSRFNLLLVFFIHRNQPIYGSVANF